jgi:hypothetical protein
MGLKNEIEQIFQQVLEHDLERISRSAEPSYHWPTTPPISMFVHQSPSAGSSSSTAVSFVPQDYQVVRIELNPFRVNPEELRENLNIIKSRRKRRGVKEGDFERNLEAGKLDDAYHDYIAESGARNPIPIVPRRISIDDAFAVTDQIISVAGVDYLLEEIAQDKTAYDGIKDHLHSSPLPTIDQWPEEIVLNRPDRDEKLVYVRADVISFDPEGRPAHHKLKP